MKETLLQVEQRKVNRAKYLESAKLEGLEMSNKQKNMFDMFDQRGWSTEQRIEFVKSQNGYT
jgi:hypothetical protein